MAELAAFDVDSAVAELDDAYRRRAKGLMAGPVLNRSSQAAGSEPCYELHWRLAREMFLHGEKEPERFDLGIAHGHAAVKIDPHRVEGNFWLGVNQALAAQHKAAPKAVLLVVPAKIYLRRAVKISGSYHGAGPLRVLGRLYHKSPWFAGGSLIRSKQCYEQALSLAPNNSVTLIYAAELAIETGELTRAAELLQKVIDSSVDPEWESENLRDKDIARSLLAKIT